MIQYKVDFTALPWQDLREGVKHKVYCANGKQIRLVDFSEVCGEPGWCESGHVGYVLAGSLQIKFRESEMLNFTAGDGIFLPAGSEHAHRGLNIQPGTQLLMIEDV